nr:S1/P1 Nuclease [Bacteroidia bacterium]
LSDPDETAWKIVAESYAALDSVLQFERMLGSRYPEDKKYAYENRGNQVVRVYSAGYSDNYHRLLDGQVERRMQQAIRRVAAFWYTAWLEAGQPDLPIDGTELPALPEEKTAEVIPVRGCE